MHRAEVAAFLTALGFPIKLRTLHKYATLGGGPPYRKFGRYAMYRPQEALTWALARAVEKDGRGAE